MIQMNGALFLTKTPYCFLSMQVMIVSSSNHLEMLNAKTGC
jgi:hypothetical protein